MWIHTFFRDGIWTGAVLLKDGPLFLVKGETRKEVWVKAWKVVTDCFENDCLVGSA